MGGGILIAAIVAALVTRRAQTIAMDPRTWAIGTTITLATNYR
jgi:hypothetical protein